MASTLLAEVASDLDDVLASLTVLFPGILAYGVYIGLRTEEFDRLTTGHAVLILMFTLLFQILADLSDGLMASRPYLVAFHFGLPLVLGVGADVGHRFFVSVVVERYQRGFVARYRWLRRIDVGNVSRWQHTVREYALGPRDGYSEYYAEVTVEIGDGAETVRGFLAGYSDDDIELYRYDDVATLDVAAIGELDVDGESDELTQRTEVIDRDHIASIAIYRLRMSDFRLG